MVDVYEKQEALYEERKAICEACPLYKKVGDRIICNPNLYLNIEDKTTISDVPRVGFKRGCGCWMNGSKWRMPNSKCTLGKW